MLQKIVPILPSRNLEETKQFFTNKLTFIAIHFGNFLLVKKDLVEIHFVEWNSSRPFTPATCYIYVTNIEDLFAKFTSLDVMNPKGDLKFNARGKKEFQVADSHGNVLVFGEV